MGRGQAARQILPLQAQLPDYLDLSKRCLLHLVVYALGTDVAALKRGLEATLKTKGVVHFTYGPGNLGLPEPSSNFEGLLHQMETEGLITLSEESYKVEPYQRVVVNRTPKGAALVANSRYTNVLDELGASS